MSLLSRGMYHPDHPLDWFVSGRFSQSWWARTERSSGRSPLCRDSVCIFKLHKLKGWAEASGVSSLTAVIKVEYKLMDFIYNVLCILGKQITERLPSSPWGKYVISSSPFRVRTTMLDGTLQMPSNGKGVCLVYICHLVWLYSVLDQLPPSL